MCYVVKYHTFKYSASYTIIVSGEPHWRIKDDIQKIGRRPSTTAGSGGDDTVGSFHFDDNAGRETAAARLRDAEHDGKSGEPAPEEGALCTVIKSQSCRSSAEQFEKRVFGWRKCLTTQQPPRAPAQK